MSKQTKSAPPVRKNADDHTYDKGYQRWEKFNVDGALEQVDQPVWSSTSPATPASIVAPFVRPDQGSSVVSNVVGGSTKSQDRDEAERERGNEYYKQGNFEQAIKFYTRSIGFNPRNPVVYSNRAMSYLKIKDYSSAESDCSCALELDPEHTKSLSRRGTARNALGRHQAAFLDFSKVKLLDPSNKQAVSECNRTREYMKASVRKAPSQMVQIQVKELTSPVKVPLDKEKEKNEEVRVEKVEKVHLEAEESPDARKIIDKQSVSNIMNLKKKKKEAPKQCPKTRYEFERLWKELKGDLAVQFEFITETLDVVTMKKLFLKSPIEADMLVEMVEAIHSGIETDTILKIRSFVECLDSLPGMDMSLMFLSQNDKAKLSSLLCKLPPMDLKHIGKK